MIAFRQTVEADIPSLLGILAASPTDHDEGAKAKVNSNYAGWVACLNNLPVAFALADRWKGNLRIIAVMPDHRRHGIGRELMRQAEAWLFSHGWKEIHLAVSDKSHERCIGFFHRQGWVDERVETEHRVLKKDNPRSSIKLEEHVVTDTAIGCTRLIRLQRGPADIPHRLCLFLDGEHYWRDMDALPLLNALFEKEGLPPMTLAFVGHVSGAARHEDYTCNKDYCHFLGDTVMKWLQKEIPNLLDRGHTIVGLSLSGLMAVYQTLQYPQHFSFCLSQSGSHWWKYQWFEEMARLQGPTQARFWLSVGDQETETNVKHSPADLLQEISQIAGVKKTAQLLQDIGGTVHYHQYGGGHSLGCWRNELSEALLWLWGAKQVAQDAAAHS